MLIRVGVVVLSQHLHEALVVVRVVPMVDLTLKIVVELGRLQT